MTAGPGGEFYNFRPLLARYFYISTKYSASTAIMSPSSRINAHNALPVYRLHFHRLTLCVSAVFAVARCPSVRPSDTLVYCIQTAEEIVKLLSQPGSPITLVFEPKRRYPIPRETPSAGAQNTLGSEKFTISTEIAIYLYNGTR